MTESGGKTPIEVGIYIHIPFCKTKCSYCDFLSFLLPREGEVAEYISGVKKELQIWAAKLENSKVVSVYIGGGTPSIVSPEYLEDIVGVVKEYYSPGAWEFTLEANPGTLSLGNLFKIKAIGVNRLSLGVQAMDDRLLEEMGRLHNRREAVEAVYMARKAGINNISIDLMYGLPGQTREDWNKTLNRTLELRPEHISAYGLTLAPNTPWGKQYSHGNLILPGEDEWADMYESCREVVAREGYRQYEISNFALPGYECRHNLGYWYRRPYIGAGLGASSFIFGTRYRNYSHLEDYLGAVSRGQLPVGEEELIDREQAMSETMFLNLRTREGVDMELFEEQYGIDLDTAFNGQVQSLEQAGILIRAGTRLKMNANFFNVSNEVFCKFLFP